jgi:hypothetical protein
MLARRKSSRGWLVIALCLVVAVGLLVVAITMV